MIYFFIVYKFAILYYYDYHAISYHLIITACCLQSHKITNTAKTEVEISHHSGVKIPL